MIEKKLNIYRASAGSGKTYRLTKDYISLLFDSKQRNPHRHIMAVTFTNKATAEMKSRILSELYALSVGAKSDYRADLLKAPYTSEAQVNKMAHRILIDILHDYHFFNISTIDRFFQHVVRSFAREIGVGGAYNLELDSKLVMQQATDNLFLNLSANEELLKWLTAFAEDIIEKGKSWNIKTHILALGEEIFKENYQFEAEQTGKKLHDKKFLIEYRKMLKKLVDDFDEKCKSLAINALDILKKNGLEHKDFSHSRTEVLDKIAQNIDFELKVRFREMCDDVTKSYTKTSPNKAKIEAAYANGFGQKINELVNYFDENIKYKNSALIVLKNLNTLGIMSDLGTEIKNLMDEQNSMLISDTNLLINKIIDKSDSPFIYEKTGIFINNFMIDEFQDTSVLQWKNFKPLIDNSLAGGNFNLLVGDVKQSIYRWRNSNWQLLDQEVFNDFRAEQIHTENLDTNWRSDRNIVNFNNALFQIAPQVLQNVLNNQLTTNDLEHLQTRITHAYEAAVQKCKPAADEGFVRFELLEQTDENDEKWTEQSLNRLPALLEDVQQRGYLPNRVAILVRRKSEAQKVVRTMLDYKASAEAQPALCYDVMSNEGLCISLSGAVRFLVAVLHLLQNKNNLIEKTIANYEYLNAKNDIDCIADGYQNTGGNAEALLLENASPADNDKLLKMKNLPLFEMVEQIIALFDVGNWANAAVFVQAFQDVVYQFSTGKTASLNDFLAWWDNDPDKHTISVPENQTAFRVMTVHKAKGLDFDVVIMPFVDWRLEHIGDILWHKTEEQPFAELSLLPVGYEKTMGNSIFSKMYFDEKMQQLIDNLNIVYVAFTRARHELFCFAPFNEAKETEKINALSQLFLHCFQQPELNPFFDRENGIFEMGKPTQNAEKQEIETEIETSQNLIDTYPSTASGVRLKIHQKSRDFWQEKPNDKDNRLNFGLLMHDVLRRIRTRAEQPKIVEEMLREGKIDETEKTQIENELAAFWAIPQTAQWFRNEAVVITERNIITPTGETYRPDRIVIENGKATVI
ncbi:MAG: UvrD-helicase domain-containing protein, partial [Prevotellaceae bacterium]|nr:UvrD-helicase domain-containing protein [Prevotellaceae bacterium]